MILALLLSLLLKLLRPIYIFNISNFLVGYSIALGVSIRLLYSYLIALRKTNLSSISIYR